MARSCFPDGGAGRETVFSVSAVHSPVRFKAHLVEGVMRRRRRIRQQFPAAIFAPNSFPNPLIQRSAAA